MYSEYAGLTAEVASLIEGRRINPQETKCDILLRVLSVAPAKPTSTHDFDLGQGAKLRIGEKLFLFLNEEAKQRRKPDGEAEIRGDGIYLDGERIQPSKGSSIHPAMQKIQHRLNHRNPKGELISLSAWRQWHVLRDGKLIPLLELKDPELAHRRGRSMSGEEANRMLRDLGLL